VASAADAYRPGGGGGDEAIDAVVKRGDQTQCAVGIGRVPATDAVDGGQECGGDRIVDDGCVAQHDGVGGECLTDGSPHGVPKLVRCRQLWLPE
jgi:hypothetical protein